VTGARFQDRVAVITGGGKGIGRAIAARLACGGAKVVLSGRDAAALETARGEIQGHGGEALAVPGDVSKAADAEQLCAGRWKPSAAPTSWSATPGSRATTWCCA